jgi:hypothetical protein
VQLDKGHELLAYAGGRMHGGPGHAGCGGSSAPGYSANSDFAVEFLSMHHQSLEYAFRRRRGCARAEL